MKTKCAALLLAILTLTFCLLPFSSYGAQPNVSLSNVSGAVYPGCTMTLAVLVSGEGIRGLQGNPIVYDSKQLTPVGDPVPGIDGWICSVGEKNFLAVPATQTAKTLSGSNLALVKFSFTLNEGVSVGDVIELSVSGVRVAADENYSGNLKYTVTVVEEPINTNCDLVTFSCAQGEFTPAFDGASEQSDYTVTVKVHTFKVTVIVEHSCRTEHFLTGNTLLVTSLLDQRAQSLSNSVRSLDILYLKYGSRLIGSGKYDRTDTKYLLPDRLLKSKIQHPVQEYFFGSYIENAFFIVKLILAETIDREGNGQSQISLSVLPKNLFLLGKIRKSVNSSHMKVPPVRQHIALHKLYYIKNGHICANKSKMKRNININAP